jgi:hypothetical protein
MSSMSLKPPEGIVPLRGLIWNMLRSRMAFSMVSSSEGSPGSAHGSNSIWWSLGSLNYHSRSVPPMFYTVIIIFLLFTEGLDGR